jgi:hypothetical protein
MTKEKYSVSTRKDKEKNIIYYCHPGALEILAIVWNSVFGSLISGSKCFSLWLNFCSDRSKFLFWWRTLQNVQLQQWTPAFLRFMLLFISSEKKCIICIQLGMYHKLVTSKNIWECHWHTCTWLIIIKVPLIKIIIWERTSISANPQKRFQFLGRSMHLIKVALNVLNVLCFNFYCSEQVHRIWALCHEYIWGSGGIVPLFLNSALGGGEWLASCPCCSTPRERSPSTHEIGGCVGPRAWQFHVIYYLLSCCLTIVPCASVLDPQDNYISIPYYVFLVMNNNNNMKMSDADHSVFLLIVIEFLNGV